MNEYKRSLRTMKSGVAALSLAMLLTSCVTLPVPPAQYLEDCETTYLTVENPQVRDIVQLAEDRKVDLQLCNLDKRALRAWYDGYEDACGWRCRSVER